jgi:putative redox protein
MTKRAQLVHRGGLRFDATSGSGHGAVLDSAEGGTGAGPRELLLVALGACGGMDVAAILAKKRQQVTRHEITVVGEERAEQPHVFTTVVVTHEVDGPDLDPEAVRRAVELSATRYCPVNAMLAAGPVTVEHRYVARSLAGTAEGRVVVVGPYGAGLDPAVGLTPLQAAPARRPGTRR